MPVLLLNRLVQNPNSLSDLGRLALTFIDGGVEWLMWAVSAPTAKYSFPDESTLLTQVQYGLHASHFAYLPTLGLMVSPLKLLTLGWADLRTLALAEGGSNDGNIAGQLKRICTNHHLLTGGDLAQAAPFLTQLGVAQAPLFQFLTFEDQAALYHLAVQPQTTPSIPATEAAAFALGQARTVLEFVDYFRFYESYCGRLPISATPDQRAAQAEAALLQLLPLLFDSLDSPQVPGLVPPTEVAHAVSAWLRQGRSIGVARLSLGAQLIAQNTVFQNQTGSPLNALVRTYFAGAQALIAAQPVQQGILAQDGASCIFPLRAGDQYASLLLGPTGVITLHAYGLRPQSDPATTLKGIATPSTPPSSQVS